MRRLVGFIFLSILLFPIKSYSWGSEGHRIMSQITSENLNSIVKDSLKVYLGSIHT